MIPPEPDPPEPDPPVPETKSYTATSSTNITIGSTTGVVYDGVKDDDVSCLLTVSISASPVSFTKLIINEVPAFDQVNYYFCNSDLSRCLLASNSEMGVDCVLYRYDSSDHTMHQLAWTGYLDSSTPSDYYSTVKSGEFDIEVVQ